jgi:Protein of unknown function (DUF2510)
LAAPTNFDTTRIRFGEMIAAGAGIVLIISLFLEWYTVDIKGFTGDLPTVTGWRALGFIDILLFLIGVIAIAVAVLRAMNVMPRNLPASTGFIVLALGGLAVLLVLYRILSIPDEGAGNLPGVDVGRGFGVFIALIAAAGVALGGWLTWNEEGKPKPTGVGGRGAGGGALGQGGQPPSGGAQPQAPAQPQQETYSQPAAAAAPAASAPAAQPDAPAGAKADWYPDPRGEKRLRYWDGSQWTDHTAD